ncbi:diguanylate cyclase (GGDEF) domain-containing protein [Kaistia soli DSM 19436]|uniref:Diguanylate cyclase (GGDEF) domain-containing protein n=1 Tax=Kaistia soli DSM 19436 TaxID=1122133 RepID=A0A1M5C7I9_9HYPH|nr:sensor domain-containing diguanylate cyclase [Kaistia soli]SHF50616.1 diguanylate cyclase (GGDEF) domain-containing protein [Kaistia soli DSM 19436]
MRIDEHQAKPMPGDDDTMFDLAPIPLWLEDYSALKKLFDEWRAAGIADLDTFLRADPARVVTCSNSIRLIKVNRQTLKLYGAADVCDLERNLDSVFRNEMLDKHIGELIALWDGKLGFTSNTVNYTLSGERLDIQLRAVLMPGAEESWSRVLVSTENVTPLESAYRSLQDSDAYARGLFDHSPVSLWVEDFSSVKKLMDDLKRRGIVDFRVFTDVHPEFVARCISEIRVIDVNRHTLELFSSPDKATLLNRLGDVFRDNMEPHFREQLIDLWQGKLFQQREVINYALDGRELHVLLQFSVLPGHEQDWSLVQVALTDITARKAAEAYLEFLGKHDALTKLYNRSFYIDELARLQRNAPFPVTIIMADLNGLKETNDRLGHAAGDELLRRAGEVLGKLIEKPGHAARIGGDEFAIILPGTDQAGAQAVIDNVHRFVDLNNQFYSSLPLSISMGAATGSKGERLEDVVKRADALMYEAKHAFYQLT